MLEAANAASDTESMCIAQLCPDKLASLLSCLLAISTIQA